MANLDKSNLEHLAKLARIDLDPAEEDRILADLGKILNYFEELRTLDTSSIKDARTSNLKNVFREDGASEKTNDQAGLENFPSKHRGFLKVPPVFE